MNPIHKKIAEIMKLDNLDIERVRKAGHKEKDLAFYEGMNTAIKRVKWQLVELANLLEEEDKKITHCNVCNLRLVQQINCPEHGIKRIPFIKTQFLKTVGVEK